MSEQKIIGIFGCEQTDICIYLANILENMKYHVLVIDNSFEQKMRFCIPRPREKLNTITYKNVDYMALCGQKFWKSEHYDVTIINLGSWPDEQHLSFCDELICAVYCEKCEMEKYDTLIAHVERPTIILFRDFCKNYMNSRKIRDCFSENNCFVTERFFLPFSETDECSRLMMQFDGYHNFLNLSREFEKVLFYLCRNISECGTKQILNGMRRAKKGECL